MDEPHATLADALRAIGAQPESSAREVREILAKIDARIVARK